MVVLFHKPSIKKKENFSKKYFLYFYALRLLLERATKWSCNTANESMHLVLSNRKGLNVENLQAYFERLKTSGFVTQDNIVWESFVHNEIHIFENKNFRGLQVADAVVSAAFKAVELSKYQTLEPRYIQEAKPLFARYPYAGFKALFTWPPISSEVAARLWWQRASEGK